jgi:hypothetical protein
VLGRLVVLLVKLTSVICAEDDFAERVFRPVGVRVSTAIDY